MIEEQTKQSFGRYLNAMRLEAGLGLEDISGETKIGKHTLEAIEEENHAKLPEPVYVMGFIRSFARVVGADGDWAVSNYKRSRGDYSEMKQSQSEYALGKDSFWPRFLLGTTLAIALVIAAYFAYSYYKKNFGAQAAADNSILSRQEASAAGTETAVESAAERSELAADAEDTPNPAPDGAPNPAGATSVSIEKKVSKYQLIVEAADKTWIKIIADNRQPDEYGLLPGEKITVEADEKFNILVGNAGCVKLNLNGKPVDVPGRSGQMVNIELP